MYLDLFKGTVHPEMKMHSLSTHPYADGGVGELLESTKHLWSLSVNSVAAESNTIEDISDRSSEARKQQKKHSKLSLEHSHASCTEALH